MTNKDNTVIFQNNPIESPPKKRTFNFSKLKNNPKNTQNESLNIPQVQAESQNNQIPPKCQVELHIKEELLLTQLADNDVIENYLQAKHGKVESGNHATLECPTDEQKYAKESDELISSPIAIKQVVDKSQTIALMEIVDID